MKFTSLALQEKGALLSFKMAADPYPVYAELREKDPVHFDETLNGWVLTRYEDIIAVLKDARFSVYRVGPARNLYPDRYAPIFDDLEDLLAHMEGEDHHRIRELVHVAFTRTAVDQYAEHIKTLANGFLDNALAHSDIDLVRDFTTPIPVTVIGEVVGIPENMRPQIKSWSDDYASISIDFYTGKSTTEALEKGMNAILEFRAYLSSRIAEIRENPEDNLLSSLVLAEKDNDVLSTNEILSNTILVLAAGNETTTATLGNAIRLLHAHPDQVDLLKSNPDLYTGLVDEVMRHSGPVQYLGRYATEDTELGNRTIRKGDLLVCVVAAGNRDPQKFENPDTFDITREHIHHLSFGSGRHMCAGFQLGKLEARVALEAYVSRMHRLELVEQAFVPYPVFNMHGPVRLLAKSID
nr:cytochrome P450 [uncultured Roseibium sp.]